MLTSAPTSLFNDAVDDVDAGGKERERERVRGEEGEKGREGARRLGRPISACNVYCFVMF